MHPTKRFSDRVEEYVKYRPHYPQAVFDLLEKEIGLNASSVVADIGSGTGISSELFVENGLTVYAVEPNKEMREAAEHLNSNRENFTSINGTAEQTTLSDQSIDVIVCAQAFHWFDHEKAKAEFNRVLKPDGHIVLVWNQRDEKTPFQQDYEDMLVAHATNYSDVTHRNISYDETAAFFHPKKQHIAHLENYQLFDLEGLKGRLLSSSYCPKEGPEYENILKAITELFHKHEKNGQVRFEYSCNVYWS